MASVHVIFRAELEWKWREVVLHSLLGSAGQWSPHPMLSPSFACDCQGNNSLARSFPLRFPTSLIFLQQYFPATIDVYTTLEAILSCPSCETSGKSGLHHLSISPLAFPPTVASPPLCHMQGTVPSHPIDTAKQSHISQERPLPIVERGSLHTARSRAIWGRFSECPCILLVIHFCRDSLTFKQLDTSTEWRKQWLLTHDEQTKTGWTDKHDEHDKKQD